MCWKNNNNNNCRTDELKASELHVSVHLPSGSSANCWHSWECAQRQHVWLNKETLMLFRPAITARSSFSIAWNSLLNLFSTNSHIIECDSPRQPNGRLCLFSRKWGPAKCLATDSLFKDGHSAEHPSGVVGTLTYRAVIVQRRRWKVCR